MKTLISATLLLILASGFNTKAQKFPALSKYTTLFYELTNEGGQEVVKTKCKKALNGIELVYDEANSKTKLIVTTNGTLTTYIVEEVKERETESDNDLILNCVTDKGESFRATFFYDEYVKKLIFTHNDKESTYIASTDLTNFKVVDSCN